MHVFLLQWGRSVVHCKEPDHRRDGMQYMCFYCSGEEVWYIAKNLITGEMGYIPSNYVVIDDNNPETQE